ncbi:MAG: hypothetical protein HKP48_09120 [Winogradskyella sp.]|uniref:DUF5687 family protein n=1 Tax=Winogradskyella sp. TaxID=1883156 RepID=UPI0017AFBED4|nr:DUF5687 family protein [Winogradskyella sp.]MBT8243824.1 hypothetical protein [Winogradskyella sp.]NNK23432.1 hypothetical protein [Winogradskyella sp.]
MIKHFLNLEWKSFIRSASFKTNLILKIIMAIGAFFMLLYALGIGVGAYYLIEKYLNQEPLSVINKILVFYLIMDLAMRYFLQKMPIVNIKPLLHLPIKKNTVVNFGINKTLLSFFNYWHAFIWIPFSVVLLIEGHSFLNVMGWHLTIMALVFSNNFINIFVNDKDSVFYSVIAILIVLGGLLYYNIFDITEYTKVLFLSVYDQPYFAIIPIAIAFLLYKTAFKHFRNDFYLDAGLSKKVEVGETENMAWLDRFGKVSTFLKNDIKLIKRNKRSKTTVIMSVLFIFYGLLFFTGSVKAYDGPFWRIFAGIFVSGGFLFSFGQFVPSWDSAYYQLLMSQNITYKSYLESKWYLMVIATVISTILAVFYLYFGWQAYAAVVAGAIYNIGVNSHLVLWGGAYIKTPIDLSSSKKAFGDKKSFNVKTLLLTLPKLVLPMVIYAIGHFAHGEALGYILVVITGILGFLFKDKVFNIIEKVYKTEKYKTIAAYKQKN